MTYQGPLRSEDPAGSAGERLCRPSESFGFRLWHVTHAWQRRLETAAFETIVIDHGYCVSLYVTDPNGLNLEFTVDHPAVEGIAAKRSASAHEDLRRWLAGDRSTNNEWRVETKSAVATS